MKNKRAYPHRSIFLLAAEKQFQAKDRVFFDTTSNFSCINIALAGDDLNRHSWGTDEFYRRYFRPKECYSPYWWARRQGKWDHESRIFALLFAAEMLRR